MAAKKLRTARVAISTAAATTSSSTSCSPGTSGARRASGTITVTDKLPPGLTTNGTAEGTGWTCTPEGPGASEVTCTTTEPVRPGRLRRPDRHRSPRPRQPGEGDTPQERAVVSGGGAAEPVASEDDSDRQLHAGALWRSRRSRAGQLWEERATRHDRRGLTRTPPRRSFFFNTLTAPERRSHARGNVKDVDVKLPEGFIGNPQAVVGPGANEHLCTQAEFVQGLPGGPGTPARPAIRPPRSAPPSSTSRRSPAKKATRPESPSTTSWRLPAFPPSSDSSSPTCPCGSMRTSFANPGRTAPIA